MVKPFVDKDSSAFVNDPNFTKFIGLYFGDGTKITFRQEWVESFEDGPAQKILLVHVPHLSISDGNARLVKFWELMGEMKDYPMNLIIDTNYSTQEDYLINETNRK